MAAKGFKGAGLELARRARLLSLQAHDENLLKIRARIEQLQAEEARRRQESQSALDELKARELSIAGDHASSSNNVLVKHRAHLYATAAAPLQRRHKTNRTDAQQGAATESRKRSAPTDTDGSPKVSTHVSFSVKCTSFCKKAAK